MRPAMGGSFSQRSETLAATLGPAAKNVARALQAIRSHLGMDVEFVSDFSKVSG